MFKFKFVLPMLAFVLAIGMSFAFTNATEDDYYVTGYVIIENEQYPVEVNCDLNTNQNCTVEIDGLSGEFTVFDALTNQPIKDGTGVAYQISDPRN